jgi:ankyrin repeat protein
VYCQLVYLRGCQPGSIRHALSELPETLDETYECTLREINKADSELAHRLFQCVAVSSRPLRVKELAEFLAFDFNAGRIPMFHEDWRPEDPLEAVLSTCSTLLSLVKVNDSAVIQFSHFSVKEFLMSTRFAEKRDAISCRYHISMISAHSIVAQACLCVLLHLDENITSVDKFPLAVYAAKHWIEHAQFEGVSQTAEQGMKQLFDPSKPHLAVWLWIYDPIWPHARAERSSPPRATSLHYAAFCGLHTIVKFLVIEHPQNVHSRDLYEHSTALHLASRRGKTEIARTLVEHGAHVLVKDDDGWTPLHLASSHGHVDLAEVLVKHGADMSTKDSNGSTPLHAASYGGHVGLTRFLLEHGADVSATSKDGSTLLHRASYGGHVDLARLLVERGANVSAKSKDGWTPLHGASYGGYMEDGLTPLHVASYGGHMGDGSTPLRRPSYGGHVDFVQYLVEHGVDVSAKVESGFTPLHLASSRGYMDVVRFLIEHGADVSAKAENGLTPLHLASEGHLDVAQFLVEHNANVSAKDEWMWTSLHRASSRGQAELARFLIKQGADLSVKTVHGYTPLDLASCNGHEDLERFLLQLGAS